MMRTWGMNRACRGGRHTSTSPATVISSAHNDSRNSCLSGHCMAGREQCYTIIQLV
jgi:hypothetical protein